MKRNLPYVLLLAMAVLAFWPSFDLGVSHLFFAGTERFFWRYTVWGEFVRKAVPTLIIGTGVFLLLIGLGNILLKESFLGVTWRAMAYLALSMALGPGLIVNWLFKDHWGRARPSTIEDFGGKLHYTQPFVIADQCDDNCSFASGHAAIAFWTFALAMLLPERWRRLGGWCAIAFGLLIGLVRVIQGAHFYSDVMTAGLVTVGTAWALRPILKPAAPKTT